jgi:hypothetical protein
MTTSTIHEFVAGTLFRLVPLPVLWDEGTVTMVGDHDAGDSHCYDHTLGCSAFDFYLGPDDEGWPDDLPCVGVGDCEPAVVWGLQAPGDERFSPVPAGTYRVPPPLLWRRDDAEWLARQLHAACPTPRRSGGDSLVLPHRVADWMQFVVPLLNRGLPRELVVGCRAYTEATRDREGR